MINTKICDNCKIEKQIADFYSHKGVTKSGISFYYRKLCRICHNLQCKENSKLYYVKHKKSVVERCMKWQKKNPGKYKEYRERYNGNNLDKISSYNEQYKESPMYAAKIMKRQGILPDLITDDIIDIKITTLKINRLCKRKSK